MSLAADNNTPGKQQAQEPQTTARRARRAAEQIERLGAEIHGSFTSSDSGERTARLRQVGLDIQFSMLPVISWLERRRPADTAQLVKTRLLFLLGAAVHCAGLDIPEYAGGKVVQRTEKPSEGAKKTASLDVTAKMVAVTLLDWANDIEAEDVQAANRSQDDERTGVKIDTLDQRLCIDRASNTVTLDGKKFGPIDPNAVAILEVFLAIKAEGEVRAVPYNALQRRLPNCNNDKTFRRWLALLPPTLRECIKGKPGAGRWLELPPQT